MRLTTFATAAAVAALPLAAAAATIPPEEMLQMRIGGAGGTVILDNADEDSDSRLGYLVVMDTPETGLTGFDFAVATGMRLDGPPLDRFFAEVELTNASDVQKSILIEITANFQNPDAGPQWPGAFSATVKDVTGNSDWLVQTWIGSDAYDRNVLAIEATGIVTAISRIRDFDPRNHWITHVFDNTSPPNTNSGASADFVAPIPVPAAGFLLLGALGGLAAMRRRPRA